jgi:hypothetical protein
MLLMIRVYERPRTVKYVDVNEQMRDKWKANIDEILKEIYFSCGKDRTKDDLMHNWKYFIILEEENSEQVEQMHWKVGYLHRKTEGVCIVLIFCYVYSKTVLLIVGFTY